MDANVEKARQLLEAGYKITRIEMKFDSVDGAGTIEHMVTLEKGEERQVIRSVNSQEFQNFIIHFKRARDKYDNAQFVYIKDLERYNKIVESQHDPEVLQDHHKLTISGREFSQGITTMSLRPAGHDNRIGTAQIWVDLDKNPDFKDVDFKDEIEVRDRSDAVVLRGYVRNYQSSDRNGFVSIQDMTLRMESERITVELNDMNPADSMGLLAEAAGFTFRPHGVEYNTSPRAFIVIMPVQNFIIDQSFAIGDVEFYQDFNSLDDGLIRKSNTGRTNPVWNGNFPRARIQVTARQFFEAITKGYDAICRAMDVISFRTDWSFPSIELGGERRAFMFSYYKHLSRVKGSTLVYCREVQTRAHTFFNTESIVANVLSFEADPQGYFAEANELCADLLRKENLSDEESRVLQVLHWLRKSIQEGKAKDKFLDLWVAFEFLTSGTSMPKLFKPSEISNLIKVLEGSEFSQEQKRAIRFRIGQLNEPSLMTVFNHLVKRLCVSFTDAELKTLSTARKKRSDIIHGKKAPEIKAEELNKMRTILEKVLIQRIVALKSLQ